MGIDVILPFSGLKFFLLFFSYILFLHIFKKFLASIISYNYLLFISLVLYIILFMPKTFQDAILYFLLYIYLAYWVFTSINYKYIIIPMLTVALPMILYKLDIGPLYKVIGISYVTFRVIQAIMDSKNFGKLNFFDFTTFVLFPPTLLAGPIDRSYRFKDDLDNGYKNLTFDAIDKGWNLLIVGILFKFVFAELVNNFWMSHINLHSISLLDMTNSAYAYTTYLFFDFAGYSAMAVGLSIMIGINIPRNFNQPYLASNPQDFWRRFHITLGSWLTDYFFKPIYKWLHGFKLLKGKRLLIQNIAIIMTFLLMGLWNGLTWYYILSGFLFGLFSAIHNTYVIHVKKGGYDFFTSFSPFVSLNLKRFLMVNAAVLALYIFSGRVPV